MKNTFGENVTLTVFGESHGSAVGAVIDGLAPGIPVDNNFISRQLSLRRPSGEISTSRREKDEFIIESGVFEGKTTGTPICILISNTSQDSRDYSELKGTARPGHADYAAFCKYHGFEDYRGGGHFSGRITAAIVAAGAIAISALASKGIFIGTHISSCAGVSDRNFTDYTEDIKLLSKKEFPVLDDNAAEAMKEKITAAKAESDSVGGILQTVIYGMPAGIGEPYFDSIESLIAHAVFSVGGVKGIEFGVGYGFAAMRGSEANDSFRCVDGKTITVTNNNGGINGGISNGMPIIFDCVIKPTPSIYKKQDTVNFAKGENISLEISGRHDPCIVHRARVVIDSLCAFVLCDFLCGRFGTDYLKT
jgi:chorismate synthase